MNIHCNVTADGADHFAYLQYAVLDSDLFEQGYARLQEGAFYEDSYTDTSLRGKVNAPYDGILYTSIPYEAGWSAYLDGERVQTEAYHGAFVSLPINRGEHTVELRYLPDGLIPGALLSVIGIAASVISILFFRKRKRRPADPSDDN